ncbi:hypothetical protein BASA83_013329 [Batrachochytrium salamandrivorans]|nr:hypothetical protein BASA83_013329 [Batrachochytrium salamandrivorans]
MAFLVVARYTDGAELAPNYSRRKTRASSKAFPSPVPGSVPATGGTPTHSPPLPQYRQEPSVSLPDKFNGNRLKLRTFLNQLELVFLINPSRYNSEGIKVATAGTLLTDVAASWFNPILENPHDNHATLNSWPAFKALLTRTFSATDVTADLDWNEAALIHRFRVGLSAQVKNIYSLHHEYPKTLEEFSLLAIKVDARIQEHHLETQITWTRDHTQRQRTIPPHPHQNRYQQTPSQRLPPVSAPTNPMMMDLDATRRGPITPQERDRRFQGKLCFRCGKEGHFRAECP